MLFLPRSITLVSMLFMALCHLGLTDRSLSAATGSILIKSPTDRSQLLLSDKVVDNDSGRTYDLDATRKAQYLVANPAIVRIDDRASIVDQASSQWHQPEHRQQLQPSKDAEHIWRSANDRSHCSRLEDLIGHPGGNAIVMISKTGIANF